MAALLALAITFCSISLLSLGSTAAPRGGFSVELVHRESPKSPYYNPDQTPSQRLLNAVRRSVSRANRIAGMAAAGAGQPVSEIVSSRGEYLMNISIGTPPVEIIAIADTGSDLIWTQCKPCDGCFKQIDPLFDPRRSSTYHDVSCSSSDCGLLPQTRCDSGGDTCQYTYQYGDQSYTNGNVALETVALASTSGRPVSFPKTLFGCGHDNAGTFGEQTSGIVGLGSGAVSLVSQMGRASGNRFSYCLVPFYARGDKSSKLSFGRNAVVAGLGAVSTPLLSRNDSFYYLTIEGVSVGSKRIDYLSPSRSKAATEGNIIIDSGTTLTLLPDDLYSSVESEVSGRIPLEPVQTDILPLCYKTQKDIVSPVITVHFTGADLKLSPSSTYIRVDEETVCFAFKATSFGLAIYGNLAQMNYWVGYDMVKNVVSFKPTDCSKF